MICKHCQTGIHETSDDNVPFVHDEGGNAMCANGQPASITDVFDPAFRRVAKEAEPDMDSVIPERLLSINLLGRN